LFNYFVKREDPFHFLCIVSIRWWLTEI
jgi:hypothetical protein